MNVKKILTIGYWLVIAALLVMAGGLFLTTFDTPLKARVFSVQSGSMEPAVPLGSLVIVRPREDYQVDDVITVTGERDAKQTVTHRVIEVLADEENDKISYVTKGDANEDPDPEPIDRRRVLGKVVFKLPYLGYPVAFAQTGPGFVSLIIVPATIIVYSEVTSIKSEVGRMIKAKKKKKKKKADFAKASPAKAKRKIKKEKDESEEGD